MLTPSSGESCICSARPIKSMSGRWLTHSVVRRSSACERAELSVDWRAWRSWVRAVCASGGSSDIMGVACDLCVPIRGGVIGGIGGVQGVEVGSSSTTTAQGVVCVGWNGGNKKSCCREPQAGNFWPGCGIQLCGEGATRPACARTSWPSAPNATATSSFFSFI